MFNCFLFKTKCLDDSRPDNMLKKKKGMRPQQANGLKHTRENTTNCSSRPDQTLIAGCNKVLHSIKKNMPWQTELTYTPLEPILHLHSGISN